MIGWIWALGLLRRRLGRLTAVASAVALVVGMVGALGSFVVFARTDLTRRAERGTVVDWQVKLAPGVRVDDALAGLRPRPGSRAAQVVGYGETTGLRSSTGGSVQATGTGVVVGLPTSYPETFPGQIRPLIGRSAGVLLAQQTAANLHAGPGDVVTIDLPGRAGTDVTIDGVVDLPNADSLFQAVGAAPASGPQAPPDNVVILPMDRWLKIFDPSGGFGTLQVHTRLATPLPADPSRAFAQVLADRKAYEVRMAGAVTVGDNLAAHLDAARTDAAYGELLFLFLGLPGLVVGIALAVVAMAAGTERRRAEQALLRARGAGLRVLVGVAAVEAVLVALIGSPVGVGLGVLAGRGLWGVTPGRAWLWLVAAVSVGFMASAAAVVTPAAWDARRLTVVRARRPIGPRRAGSWRAVAAWTLAVVAGGIVWLTTRQGYQVVVAPEGVPTVSVSYLSLLGPALAWMAGALAVGRLAVRALVDGRTLTTRLVRPVAGNLAALVSGWLARLRPVVVRSVLLLGLAVAFAVSTAVFDASFASQSRVDAELTNGADVTAAAPPGVDLAGSAARVARIRGVRAAEPMQHRFAYVGNDLQDLYGIRPSRIARATTISDAYFAGGLAARRLASLAATPNGVFVSDETVKDFRLRPGDEIRLRVLDAQTHAYIPVPFRVLGIVREFPTAPTDSFLVANASYVRRVTHSDAFETLLIRGGPRSPAAVASDVRRVLPAESGARVQDIIGQRRITATGLVAVDVRGLSLVNLVFGALATLWSVGLLLAIGFTERRRSFVILRALGATTRHLAAFAVSEAGAVVVLGGTAGAILGGSVAWILVRVLHGVFDPPPQHPAVPWAYLAGVVGVLGVGLVCATVVVVARASRWSASRLRDLAI